MRLSGRDPLGVEELARRLGMAPADLTAVPIAYRRFRVLKRGGGMREIAAPEPSLLNVQRRILRRLLTRLPAHPAAVGFERGRSLVDHASLHAGRAVVLRMDVQDFFGSTRADRVARWFASLGCDDDAVDLLERLCTLDGALPQGAPTSPRLSNLLNRRLDARLAGFAADNAAVYSRYADDLTFSFQNEETRRVHLAIRFSKSVLEDQGYTLHEKKKLHVRRPHQRQLVSGLVVNEGVRLPRERRRWLRAVEHHERTGRPTTLAPAALQGWRAYRSMVEAGARMQHET
jgi:hypothetical protein